MVRVGSYDREVPVELLPEDNSTKRSTTNDNIHSKYEKYQKEQKEKIEQYKQEQQAAFDNYKLSLGIDIKSTQPQQPVVPPETSVNNNEFFRSVAQMDETPKTGGIYAEYDEKTGITTTYNKNTNTITKTDKNGEVLSKTDFDGNPIENASSGNSDNPTVKKEKPHLADFISGISPKTKEYLKGDKRFNADNDKYIELAISQAKKENELKQAIKEMQDFNTELNNTPADDFNTRITIQKNYFEATKKVETLQREYSKIKEERDYIAKAMVVYANTIENWEDNTTERIVTTLVGFGERSGFYDRTYTRVTLPSGEKAFECNGEYYKIASDGYSPSLFDKIEE